MTGKPVVIEDEAGNKEWFLNGKLHREDGPARVWTDGDKEWYLNGLRHREDGPAVDYYGDQYKEWYVNGQLHREDGPAVKWHGREEWCVNGKLHREDGPAVVTAFGYKSWHLSGVELSEWQHAILSKKNNFLASISEGKQ